MAPDCSPDLLALDDGMKRLAEFDARKSKVVELRCFGGLSVEETAAVLYVSPFTVIRDWNLAKAWLQREFRNQSWRCGSSISRFPRGNAENQMNAA